jgi:L,D-transpeptidase YcbB
LDGLFENNTYTMLLRSFQAFIFFFFIIILFSSCESYKQRKAKKLKSQITLVNEESALIEGKMIHNPELISEVYGKDAEIILERWGNKEKVEDMIALIKDVAQEGLKSEDYHLSAIEYLAEKVFVEKSDDEEHAANLELLLTDAFFMISSHLNSGKTDRNSIDPQWNAAQRESIGDVKSFVDSAMVKDNIREAIKQLTPRHKAYENLKKALAKYRLIESSGGWENFNTELPKLALGTRHPDVVALRKRLIPTQGDVYGELEDEELFDEMLHEQVMLFQKRNGITPDGVVAKGTIEALNISVYERIATIEANLERWRWISSDLGDRYVKVNIANFEMHVIENDSIIFASDAIVGKPYRKTPVFSSRLTYLVLAPTWTIPPTILAQDVIPAVRKNPGYLKQKNMQVLKSDGSVVDPSTIDWKSISAKGFPYIIRQAPGKDNALGAAKFMFPNQYSVYIHDTPTKELFARTDRSFSSGCIRISKPLEFAAFLLRDKPDWTIDRIKNVVAQGKETTVMISKPLPVHLLYLTAWAEDDGTVHFRKDIYDRDQSLLNALKKTPPSYLPVEIVAEEPAV